MPRTKPLVQQPEDDGLKKASEKEKDVDGNQTPPEKPDLAGVVAKLEAEIQKLKEQGQTVIGRVNPQEKDGMEQGTFLNKKDLQNPITTHRSSTGVYFEQYGKMFTSKGDLIEGKKK